MDELTEVTGEHYQLDMEMSFVDKEDIFSNMEPLFYELFDTNLEMEKKYQIFHLKEFHLMIQCCNLELINPT